MNTSEQVRILSKITTRDEAGRHFMEIYSPANLESLEAEGLLSIDRPMHEATGLSYSQEHCTVEVTADGVALVEANPEDWAD